MFESRQSVGREAIQICIIVTGNDHFKLCCVKGLLIYPCLGIELKSPYDLIIELRLACRSSGFDPRSRQTQVVKTGSDSSNDKRSAIGASVTGPRR